MGLEGMEVGDYVLQERMSEGKFADIYRGVDGRGRQAAVKIMRRSEDNDTEFVQRFMREMRILEEMQDPHIVPIAEWGITEDERVYLIMPYIGGIIQLNEMLRNRRFSPHATWEIIGPIAETLDHIHGEKIVHRDVEPSNILIREETKGLQVYLGGFGFSKQIGIDPTLTKAGSHIGTAGYIAPEAVRGEIVDHRGDLYSLAVVLYEMLLGFLPIQAGNNEMSVMMAHVTKPPIVPRDKKPDFPQPLQDFLLRGLAKATADRYQTAAELAQAYENALGQISSEAQEIEY